MSDSNIPFIGKGWSFPPRFDKALRGVEMAEGEREIQESLEVLLSTRPGERLMNPSYGCDLGVLLFERLDASLEAYVEDLVRMAVAQHESRIELLAVRFGQEPDRGVVNIELDYRLRSTNNRANMVFPFYLNEGNPS